MVTLRPGMVFAVNSKSLLARAINWCQKVKATDNDSCYNHAGIIVNGEGQTFEALTKIGYSGLYKHKGKEIIVAMHKQMTDKRFNKAWPEISKLNGKMYPFPRLALHLVGLAKFIHWKFPVCSELVAKFEFECGLRKQWWGVNPDNLADEWDISKHYDVIYKGVWEG
jgi:hypothetical protein